MFEQLETLLPAAPHPGAAERRVVAAIVLPREPEAVDPSVDGLLAPDHTRR